MFAGAGSARTNKFGNILSSDPDISINFNESSDDCNPRESSVSSITPSTFDQKSFEGSPMALSPWNQPAKSNNTKETNINDSNDDNNGRGKNGLIGSLVREEGHIYSLAATKGLLYTGSDSKNIRVWKNLKEFSGFKSNSGLVKAIVIAGMKIFTGHQDGKIRIWKVSPKNPKLHRRSGTLPTLKDIFKSSIRPSNYVEVRRRRTTLWIKHSDAVSCLSLDKDQGLLYSASWDRTIKVWRIEDSKCLESIKAHDDAVNSIVSTGDGMVFTGSADGSVKVWKREAVTGKRTKHDMVQTLLEHESAVTALAMGGGSVVYCGSSDGIVNYWEKSEKLLKHAGVLKGHKLAVLCLEAAGSLVFSGSADKTICVWKREGQGCIHVCLTVLSGHKGPVKCLAVEADIEASGQGSQRWVVYSGSLDKSVKVWSVSESMPEVSQTSNIQEQEVIYDEGFRSDDSFTSSVRAASGRGKTLISL